MGAPRNMTGNRAVAGLLLSPFEWWRSVTMGKWHGLVLGLVCWLCSGTYVFAQNAGRFVPVIHDAPPDVEATANRIRRPEGFRVELVAAEPDLANPVAFCIDEFGRFFVCETFRHSDGATDTRDHMYWLKDELAATTVQDRVRMFEKYLPPEVLHRFRTYEDRVRLLVDSDGDGRVDQAKVFAGGFNNIADGIGAGVLARRGDVWYTCIPHLWLLRDVDGDGIADTRRTVYSGFGVHVAFIGHDLHGLVLGPDGRIYFSIGDRGFNVRTPDGRHLYFPHTGAILRCELDGSNLEVFHFGLRNPQELAFNRWGDLFTGDNNSDGGDLARWVHAAYGGNSGWHIGFQYAPEPVPRGMWNYEKLWYLEPENTARYLLPPLAHIGSGPSGLVYNDHDMGLPDSFDDSFFLCDFRGQIPVSGVRVVRAVQEGATYRVTRDEPFVWNVCATDCTIGWDGAVYVLDWTEGWSKPGRGRIYRVYHPESRQGPLSAGVPELIRRGFTHVTIDRLVELLNHADQRVRIEAELELATRGNEGLAALRAVASGGDGIARLHGVWGMGVMARHGDTSALEALEELLQDRDAEVRAQAARMIGEAGSTSVPDRLAKLILDESPRVRFFATIAAGQLGLDNAYENVVRMLEENNDRDPYLRHAGVMFLTLARTPAENLALKTHRSEAVRVAAVVALRRQGAVQVQEFLNDPSPVVVLEAARAIYDEPIAGGFEALAHLARPDLPETAALRVVLCLRRRATPDAAARLASIASAPAYTALVREQALRRLADWPSEPWQDPILGLYRPMPAGDANAARKALLQVWDELLTDRESRVRVAAIDAAADLGIETVAPGLQELAMNRRQAGDVRRAAIRALARLGVTAAAPDIRRLLDDPDEGVRADAIAALAVLAPSTAATAITEILESPERHTREKQAALLALGDLKTAEADRVLARWLRRLIDNRVPPELQLELLEAAEKRTSPEVRALLDEYLAQLQSQPPVKRYEFALRGGDAEAGSGVFFGNAAVACVRCHRIGEIGGEVGPDLSDVGARRDREYILRSLVDPNADIAEGYETVVIATTQGKILTGVLRKEDDRVLELVTAEGATLVVPKDEIEARRRGQSAMPADLVTKLSRRELRDLVEFLAQQKKRPAP